MTGRDIRLIAVDLDGTLLNDRKEVPPDFIPMVEALYPRGIRFVLASGRQVFNLTDLFAHTDQRIHGIHRLLEYDADLLALDRP